MTSRCLVKLCEHPSLIPELREEMITVLKSDGWAKTSLYKMQLLDSFLKEVSRTSRMAHATMGRYVLNPITLSDGTVLPRGALLQVPDDQTSDSSIYPSPEIFDAHRYLKLRSLPGHENQHQFVTLSTDNMVFGHGNHACPGRFFASNEIKILLCFLLVKYDWRFEPGYQRPEDLEFERAVTMPMGLEVQARRRVEEIDLLEPKEV